jgi:hypothetical protein
MLLDCYLFINACCTLLSLHAHMSSTTISSAFGFYATRITMQLTGQTLPQLLCRLAEDLAFLDRVTISVLNETLVTTAMIDFKCPSVKRDQLFVLLFFIREKLFTRISAVEHRNLS